MDKLPLIISKQPVILNASLRDRGYFELFEEIGQFKVRVSSSTLLDTCIFPRSSVAFLLLDGCELEREQTFERIQKFAQFHGNSHVLCMQSNGNGSGNLESNIFCLFSAIQLRLLTSMSSCFFNLVDSRKTATDTMINVSKLHLSLMGQCLDQQVADLRSNFESEVAVKTVLGSLPITSEECTLILDRCGSLANLASGSVELFMDAGLDAQTAKNLHEFFERDTYHI